MLKIHKSFFINIGIYRDILVQNRQLFAHFRTVTFWSRDRALSNSVCIKHLLVPILCPNFSFVKSVFFE